MIPVVDFSAYSLDVPTTDVDQSQLKSLADQVCHAFTDIGFVYLKNHGIPAREIEKAFGVSKSFFGQPTEVKRKYARPDDTDLGWTNTEKEKLNPERPADLKEAYNFRTLDNNPLVPNDVIPDFRQAHTDFFSVCRELTLRILDVISLGQGIDRDFLRETHKSMGKTGNMTTLRTLYYPPVVNDVKPGQIRCGEHSDYGSLTLLFQDDVGGLEVKTHDSSFIPAKPIPDTILVNLGDMMQRWTADKLVAMEHRVAIPEEEVGRSKGRYSMAFFANPDNETLLDCLDKSDKYEPMKCIDYLIYRLSPIRM